MSHPKHFFTVIKFTKENDGQLTKIISLDEHGVLKSDGSPCLMVQGKAQNIDLCNETALAQLINNLKPSQAISIGQIATEKVNCQHGDIVDVVTKRRLIIPRNGVITRSTDHLYFENAKPGFMLLDVDYKGMPPIIAAGIEAAGGVWPLICEALPGLSQAGLVIRASTSAGISNADTGEAYVKSGGSHIYIPVADAADIPRAIRALFDRLWLEDYGWMLIGGAGQMLERSLIDVSVGSPERLIFEGPPILMPPLIQDPVARAALATPGEVIDTRVVLPSLTTAERAMLDGIKRSKRDALYVEALQVRELADNRLAKKIAHKTGAPIGRVLEEVRLRHNGVLMPNHPIVFDDAGIGEVTVADVLIDPKAYIGETLADPLEGVSYGRCKAMVMGKPETGLIIHSFAHGGIVYKLNMDLPMVEEFLSKSTKETIVADLITTLMISQLSVDAVERLKVMVAKRADVGVRVINKAIADQKKKESSEQRRREAEMRISDPRVKFRAPDLDAELLATLKPVDDILSQAAVPEPPFRNVDRRHCRIVERSPEGLHELRHVDASGDKEHQLPAPAEPLICALDALGVAMDVEQYVRFEQSTKGENGPATRDVRLPGVFATAYTNWPDSKLPTVRGVSTLPMVLPGRVVVSENGLHRPLGIIFRVQQSLLSHLPDPGDVTIEAATDAYRYLTEEWLADVDTDAVGKAIVVALALTLIERHLLPARPAFFVTAGQRGGGKTTLLNMVSTAVFGRAAAAANWSPSDEERRKTIYSYMSEGIALLVLDNVRRGESISCPTIEKALTSAQLSDRILGASRTVAVPSTTVIAFTGNNISPKGDLASRSLVSRLAVSRADPENREFKHSDPIGMTIANRRRILVALFTILLVQRQAPTNAKTRFKDWWRLIGHPVELVSVVDFADVFNANDEMDEEASAASVLFTGLRDRFGEAQSFTAAGVAREINASPDMSDDDKSPMEEHQEQLARRTRGEVLRVALEEASGAKRFPPGPVKTQSVGKKLQALVDRTVLCGDETLKLRVRHDHEENRYWIETVEV